jgi:hypothetical protein
LSGDEAALPVDLMMPAWVRAPFVFIDVASGREERGGGGGGGAASIGNPAGAYTCPLFSST